ncbi:TerB family tellurite resistance protein [Rhizobiaceae bacterium BDR2-2]|uniref:TerB family tellurite resistance protein n=1 Tax=Ectorhizobium quercum TaxID=2965071 RepID=A0AAE3N4T2_9HYPH|nr:TerB family tellurite resistance protein [Ectorhizobium quercum]MCX8999255.1 TerB family tellurite resistance protein [Ectorhizobium quercum]
MWEKIQAFLKSLTGGDEGSQAFPADDPRVAVAALCIQVLRADGIIDETERNRLEVLLKEQYSLNDGALSALLKAGEAAESEAIDYYRFTSVINRSLSEEEKTALVGLLWDITYADGTRNEIEDHIVWRITDLLGVSDRERIVQRQGAEARLKAEDPEWQKKE